MGFVCFNDADMEGCDVGIYGEIWAKRVAGGCREHQHNTHNPCGSLHMSRLASSDDWLRRHALSRRFLLQSRPEHWGRVSAIAVVSSGVRPQLGAGQGVFEEPDAG